MIKRLDIFVVINIYSFCILHIFYKQGFEWSVLKAMTKLSHSQLPLQIYAELHLNRDAANNELVQGQYVGTRLRHFFDEGDHIGDDGALLETGEGHLVAWNLLFRCLHRWRC